MKALRVKESGAHFGIRDAIALNPTAFCEGCNRVVREKEMQGDMCFACSVEYDKENAHGIHDAD